MRMRTLAQWIGGLGLALATQACVVRESTPVNSGYGYGYGNNAYASGSVSVSTPSQYTVSSMPPEPLYEQMSASPGYGSVWIDGYWHWNQYEWVWVAVQNRGKRRSRTFSAKRQPSRKHFVEQDAQCPDVGSVIDPFSQSLFRRHVFDGPEGCARFRHLFVSSELGNPEVQDLHQAFLNHHDVRWLDVAVNNAR